MAGRATLSTAGVAAAATVGSGMAVLWFAVTTPELVADQAASAAHALFVVGMVALALTGWLLVRTGRHPVMGWLLVGTGLTNVLGRVALGLAMIAADAGHPAASALGWSTNWAWVPGQAVATLLLLRFPDGRLPGAGWGLLEKAVLWWAALAVLATATAPGALAAASLAPMTNPVGPSALAGPSEAALALVFTVQPLLVLAALVGQAARWRRSGSVERQQLTVVAVALGVLAVTTPLALVSGAGAVAEGLAWLVLPGSLAYAVARHDLWQMDLRVRFDRLSRVRAEERARLQRDLHDSLGPLLGSIAMRVEAVGNLLDAGAPRAEVDRVLASIGTETETALVDVRRFIDELAPSALAETDLETALRRLVQGHVDAGLHVEMVVEGELPVLGAATELALYRVAGEALHNVSRHASATCCSVTLKAEDGDVVLQVLDDGVGLREQPAGVGRRAMADRITALGGSFSLSDVQVGGVRITARLAGMAR